MRNSPDKNRHRVRLDVSSRSLSCVPRLRSILAVCLCLGLAVGALRSQETALRPQGTVPGDLPSVASKVEVAPLAEDRAIASRLRRILETTGWYESLEVRVEEGVVFLSGTARSEEHKEWAATLATNTGDVVAVVDEIEVPPSFDLDFTPAWRELRSLGNLLVGQSPLLVLGLLLLIATWFAAMGTKRLSNAILRKRVPSPLLRHVIARAFAVPVFLLGLYLVLKVSGLTRLAVTVLGGTGLLGLVLGFAFRDIAENFLASILLSIQRPFATGDRIEVAGYNGFVQSVNTRSTLLMTVEGNHVQIPNATIYKEAITNFTANPNARFDFGVGIGYDDSIEQAQEVALEVLREHPGVVADPEPLVLVEALGAATVNLRVYFWIDLAKFGQLKVRSAVIRLVKKAFDEAGVSMPDEAREVVFPAGVPVRMVEEQSERPEERRTEARPKVLDREDSISNAAEGGLESEVEEIQKQARSSRVPEEGENLLES